MVLVSPRFAVIEMSSYCPRLATRRRGRLLRRTIRLPRRYSFAASSRARAVDATAARDSGRARDHAAVSSSQRASSSAAADWASMRRRSVSRPFRITHALNALSVGPAVRRKAEHALDDHFALAEHRSAEHPALTVEILGCRVNDDVRAELERLLQDRRAKTVVDCEQRAGLFATPASAGIS